MTRFELIQALINHQSQVPVKDMEIAVKHIFFKMIEALENNERIEIRRFGTFIRKLKTSHTARNPKTGEKVWALDRFKVYFRPAKYMKACVNLDK